MIFQLDAAFALELIAIGIGVGLIVWGKQNKGEGTGLAIITGRFIAILALLGLACTSYYGISYWLDGHFTHPNGVHMEQSSQKKNSHMH